MLKTGRGRGRMRAGMRGAGRVSKQAVGAKQKGVGASDGEG